VARDLGPDDD